MDSIPCFAAIFSLGPAESNKAEKREKTLSWAKPLGLDQSNRYNCDCPIMETSAPGSKKPNPWENWGRLSNDSEFPGCSFCSSKRLILTRIYQIFFLAHLRGLVNGALSILAVCDQKASKLLSPFPNQVTVQIHCGSCKPGSNEGKNC